MSGGVDTTVVAAFAVGFVSFISPCVLPLVPGYLSAVSGVSLTEIRDRNRSPWRILLPFLLTAIAFTRATAAFRWLRDRYLIITAVSGVVLITMGVLLFTGELTQLNIEAQQALDSVGLNIFGEL